MSSEHFTVGGAFYGLPSLKAGESSEDISNHSAPNHQQKTVERIEGADYGEQLYESWTEKKRLSPHEPAPTLKAGKRANYHFAHPFDDRGLTVRERARLMSFDDDYVFKGGTVSGRRQTGNAVPPLMAKAVAESIDVDDERVTVGDVLGNIPSPSETDLPNHDPPNIRQKTVERIEGTEQGEPLYDSYNQNQRLDEDEVAPTIMVGSTVGTWKYAHPTEDRGITNRERASLQTFPLDYEFVGGRTDVLRQTGNAVPPLLAEEIASSLKH